MNLIDIIFIICFAIVLSALTGLRTFLPITTFSILAKFNLIKLNIYNTSFYNFITDDRVLLVFIIATILELLSDKIPAIDNFLDNVLIFIKPIFSFILNYNLLNSLNLSEWQLFLISFSLSLFLTSSITTSKNVIRLTSTTTTLGTFNIFISFLEDLLVIIKTVLSALFVGFVIIFSIVFIVISAFIGYKFLSKMIGFFKNVKGIKEKGII
ncbi:MAG: DUF4126 domain-containing protein [bacterium]|nr:DUF4126 domain-containing protein [bacterium]